MITSSFINLVRNRMQENLKSLEQELGIKIKVGNGSYLPSNAKIPIEIALIDSSGEVQSQEVISFKRSCAHYGFDVTDLGKTFISRGTTYRVIGLNPRAYKYPINTERVHDKAPFKFPATTVARLLKVESERVET